MANLLVHFLAGKLELLGIERAWEVKDHLTFFVWVVRLRMMVTMARVLSIFFPQQVPEDIRTNVIDSLRNTFSAEEMGNKKGSAQQQSRTDNKSVVLIRNLPNDALGRALSQAMELVTDTPASSRKYGFVRKLADTIMAENLVNGTEALLEVNRRVLKASFSRTLHLLVQNLKERQLQQQLQASSLLWLCFKAFPTERPLVPLFSVPFLGSICNILSPMCMPVTSSGNSFIRPKEEMAEKFVQEILWIAKRLAKCSAIEDATIQWSCASSLASLSINASPRVQHYLLKISMYLLQQTCDSMFSVPDDVTFYLLLLWLPFLCNLISGIEFIDFTSSQRLDAEDLLGKAILKLPKHYEETILVVWVREFTQSSSDWPDLRNCYDSWCWKTRSTDYQVGTGDN